VPEPATAAFSSTGPVAARRAALAGTLDLYLLRSIAPVFVAASILAAVAMMLERALRLIHEMAASGAHLGFFLPLLGQLVPYYVGMSLPAAFMIALIFVVTRLDETLELEAMLAGGLSLTRIALPLVGFGLVVAAMALIANGVLEPHGRYGYRTLRAAALEAQRIRNLQPGAFYSPGENLTFSFDRRAADGRLEGVFVRYRQKDGPELLISAARARLAISERDRAIGIALERGVSYQDADPTLGRGAYRLSFDHYWIAEPLPLAAGERPRGTDQKELTLFELIEERRTSARGLAPSQVDAELYSRLARSLTLPLLPLLAIPLSFAAKKARRGFGIVLGGAILTAFHHGLNTVKSLSRDGSPPPDLAFLVLTAGFCLVVLWLFVTSRHLPSHAPITDLTARIGLAQRRERARRRRRLRLPGGTIGAYVAGVFALWAVAALATITLLLQMVDLIERSDEFVDRGVGLVGAGRYALLRLPLLVQQAIAFAALAGAMFALLRLTRFSEMVAIRGAGVSNRRLTMMLLPVAAALSAASFLLADRVTPRAEVALASWWRSTDPDPPIRARWFRLDGDIVRAQRASPDGRILHDVALYRRDGAGLIESRTIAANAVATPRGWALHGADSVRLAGRSLIRARVAEARWPTSLRSDDVRALFAASPLLASRDARRALLGSAPIAEGPPRFETRLSRMLAEPLAPFVMLLFALPLAFASSRTGPTSAQWLVPMLGGMTFLVADGVLGAAAQAGLIEPAIGAWTAPLMFGLIAATILVYSEA
jgi:LPS export ABC transporter permease LptG/LPS export ABC transporter permease LptF